MVFDATFQPYFHCIVATSSMGVGRRSTRRKPPTCRQSPTHFSVTNTLIVNIAVIPEIMFKFLTFDSNGQHSTWLYDKRDDCSFIITHFPQKALYQPPAYGA
jgi:hypothetical protein